MARKQEPLTVITRVVRGDEILSYSDLDEHEQKEFWIRATKRMIRNMERARGNDVIFEDEAEPPKTVTA